MEINFLIYAVSSDYVWDDADDYDDDGVDDEEEAEEDVEGAPVKY